MKKYRTFRFGAALAAVLSMASCGLDIDEMKESDAGAGAPFELTVTAEEQIVLNERESTESALSLAWTSGSNYGTGNAIEYIVEMDKADGDWSGCHIENLGKNVYSKDFTVEELNTILSEELGAVQGTAADYKVRVTASVAEHPEYAQSEEAAFTATTYQPVAMALYLMKDGDAAGAVEMTRTQAGIFTYEALIDECSFGLLTSQGNEWPAYVNNGSHTPAEGEESAGTVFDIVYSESAPAGTGETGFSIGEKSFYRITVNLFDLTVSIEDILTDELYLIGDATPGGWSLDNLTEMEKTAKGQFTWTGNLTTNGEGFKFVTGHDFWPGYVKANEDQDDMTIEYFASDPGSKSGEDLKFKVSEVGEYTVKVNLLDLTVSYSKTGEAEFHTLYMIGEATSGGWANDKATEMEETSDGVYTWTGTLKVGNFRFIINLGTFEPGYWKANDDADDMTIVYYETSPDKAKDFSFDITEAGEYTITADTEKLLVTIEKKGGETPGPEPQEQKLFLIGDATSAGWTTENAVEMQMTSDGVYTWTGELKEGPFRFVTANGNQTYAPGYWKASKDNCDMSIVYSETSLSGDKDISFTITEAGEYTVTADTKQLFVSLTKKDFTTFEKLWIIGGLNNWSFDTVEQDATNKYVMFPDEHNPHIFRWTGEITAGEFKISCDFDKSFYGTWYMPANAKDEFTAGENKEVFLIDRGLPESAQTDRNWNLTETGNYTIAINQMTSTMTVTKN